MLASLSHLAVKKGDSVRSTSIGMIGIGIVGAAYEAFGNGSHMKYVAP